jgi:death on curing protein
MDIFKSYSGLFRNLSQSFPVEWLTTEETIALHDYIIDKWGGCEGIRDSNILSNICFKSPYLDQYNNSGRRSLYDAAAEYMWSIAAQHPFSDGNKRTAVAAALTFLDNNNIMTEFDPVLLEQLAKQCASDSRRADWKALKQERIKQFTQCRMQLPFDIARFCF